LQPIHVRDIAEMARRSLLNPGSEGRICELGRAETYTLREITEMVAARMGRRGAFIPVPFGLPRSLARLFELLPAAPFTVAQVDLLLNDSLPASAMPGLRELGILPHRLDDAFADLPAAP
jgi:uncharacterized protein YbjT (DUF2867 family)